jgi:hypothetical protein
MQLARRYLVVPNGHKLKLIRSSAALLVFWSVAFVVPGSASGQCPYGSGDIRQIDPYGNGLREIPDIENGGLTALSYDDVIDVVILGDGYYASEDTEFFNEACDWYDDLFGANGIFPYTAFTEAFRVRAVFKESTHRANNPQRESYYRVKVDDTPGECDVITHDGWWNSNGTANEDFRDNLFDAIANLDPAPNYRQYPWNLDRPIPDASSSSCYVEVPEKDLLPALAGRYRNLVVVMMMKIENCDGAIVSGAAKQVCGEAYCPTGADRVRVAFAEGYRHEFTHALSDVLDEYIRNRGSDADFENPSDPSVFLLSNLSYSNERCDLLWPHLAPNGRYNPDPLSRIGRLYRGGYCELHAWHSEYACLMNGRGSGGGNYKCDIGDTTEYYLRACQLCFWCQEVVAVRILEKTGQFVRAGDPSNFNDLGCVWYQLWDTSLRDAYYTYFGIPDRIADKNECYEAYAGMPASCLPDCSGDPIELPDCLPGCEIVEYGNAIYVDSTDGTSDGSGKRDDPINTIDGGIEEGHDVCGIPWLVAIAPGSYPPMTLDQPAILVPEGCASVVIGD